MSANTEAAKNNEDLVDTLISTAQGLGSIRAREFAENTDPHAETSEEHDKYLFEVDRLRALLLSRLND